MFCPCSKPPPKNETKHIERTIHFSHTHRKVKQNITHIKTHSPNHKQLKIKEPLHIPNNIQQQNQKHTTFKTKAITTKERETTSTNQKNIEDSTQPWKFKTHTLHNQNKI